MGAVFNLGVQDGYSGPEKLLEFSGTNLHEATWEKGYSVNILVGVGHWVFNPFTPRVPKIKIQDKLQISFCKKLKYK